MPAGANLPEQCRTFAELETACVQFRAGVDGRVHRQTRRAPEEMLAEERQRLDPLPRAPFTAASGTTRRGRSTPRSLSSPTIPGLLSR